MSRFLVKGTSTVNNLCTLMQSTLPLRENLVCMLTIWILCSHPVLEHDMYPGLLVRGVQAKARDGHLIQGKTAA